MAAWLAFDGRFATPAGFWCCGTIVDVDNKPLDLTCAGNCAVLILAGRSDPSVPLGEVAPRPAHSAKVGDLRRWLDLMPEPAGSV